MREGLRTRGEMLLELLELNRNQLIEAEILSKFVQEVLNASMFTGSDVEKRQLNAESSQQKQIVVNKKRYIKFLESELKHEPEGK